MNNIKLYALATLASLALGGPVIAADPSSNTQSSFEATPNGGYDKSDETKSTDASGTTISHTAKKSVDVDSNGDTTTKVKIKDKTSPKGLFTKSSTTETDNTSTVKDGQVKTTHVKSVDGNTVEKDSTMQQQ
jgi:hypothetical protein